MKSRLLEVILICCIAGAALGIGWIIGDTGSLHGFGSVGELAAFLEADQTDQLPVPAIEEIWGSTHCERLICNAADRGYFMAPFLVSIKDVFYVFPYTVIGDEIFIIEPSTDQMSWSIPLRDGWRFWWKQRQF